MVAEIKYVLEGEEKALRLSERAVIGRSVESDIQLSAPSVSKLHATIRQTPEGFRLDDLESKNGTYVNGQPISTCVLQPEDTIHIGGYELTFRLVEPEPVVLTSDDGENSIILDEVDLRRMETATWLPETDGEKPLSEVVVALRHRLEILGRVCELIATSEDFDFVSRECVRELMGAFPQAYRCSFLVLDGDSGQPQVRCEQLRELDDPGLPSRTVCNRALEESKCILSHNTMIDPRFGDSMSLAEIGAKSVMCAPLKGRGDPLGLLYLATRQGGAPFTTDDLQLLAGVAADVAIGMENVRLREERLKMERLAAIGQAIASMAHCIKNVLNTINCGSYIVDKGIETEKWETVSKGWTLMGSSTEFLRRMVLDMLAYSKPRTPSYQETDLGGFIREVSDSCRMLGEKSGVGLDMQTPEELLTAPIDPVAMQRCLYNLITNAIEAASGQANAQVTIGLTPEPETFQITVADNGCGMPPEVREKLFQAFFSTKGSKGTGLGLPVVAKTVEEHGGRIDVESEEGKGTCFTLTLPFARPGQETVRDTDTAESCG